MKNCFGALVIVLLFLPADPLSAVQPAVSAGAAYLAAVQDQDGIWSSGSDSVLLDSYAAVMALRNCPGLESNPALWRGAAGLLLALADSSGREENLTSALVAAAAGGMAEPTLFQRWADVDAGGWSMEIGARADLVATVLVLELLLNLSDWETGGDQPEVLAGAGYLLGTKPPDGWWRLSDRPAPGDFRLSCRIVAVLAELSNRGIITLPGLSDILSGLGDRIAQHRQPEGWFAASTAPGDGAAGGGRKYDTAVALRAMCLLGRWKDALPAYQALRDSQNQDGGWRDLSGLDDDIQTTGAAMAAMAAFQLTTPPASPDLLVTTAGVTIRSATTVNETGEWQVQALIFNQGNGGAESFLVNFYGGAAMPECLLAQADVEQLDPGRSIRVGCRLASEELPNWLVVAVDAEGRTADQNRENNLCRCLASEASNNGAPEPAALAVLGGELRLNGAKSREVTFLAPGLGAVLSGIALAKGYSGPVEYVFCDNGDTIASGCREVLDGQGKTMAMEWFPEAGQHQLTLTLATAANDRVNGASATLHVTVVDEGAMLQTWQFAQSAWRKSSTFQAREYVELETVSADPEAEVTLWVENADGVFQGTPVPSLDRPGRHHWHTGTREPGEYRACGLFRRRLSGALLAEVSAPFIIAPTETFSALTMAGVSREHVLACGQTLVLNAGAQWQALTNLRGATCRLTWRWEHDDGRPVDGWPEISRDVPVTLETLTQRTAVSETITIAFADPGMYRLALLLSVGEEVRLRDHAAFQAVDRPVPTVENRVVPECVQAGAEQVTTIIRLTVADASGDLLPGEPASFTAGDFSPFVDDVSGAEVVVPLRDIRNQQGAVVASGALVSRVEYGRCHGGGDLAPGRTEGAVTLHPISQGEAELSYAPTGNTLATGEWSTVVIAIHRAMPVGGSWEIGRQIGSLEVYLTGVKQ